MTTYVSGIMIIFAVVMVVATVVVPSSEDTVEVQIIAQIQN